MTIGAGGVDVRAIKSGFGVCVAAKVNSESPNREYETCPRHGIALANTVETPRSLKHRIEPQIFGTRIFTIVLAWR